MFDMHFMEKRMKIWHIPIINPLRRASLRAIGVGFKPNSPKEEPGDSSAVRSLSKKRASKVAGRQAVKM